MDDFEWEKHFAEAHNGYVCKKCGSTVPQLPIWQRRHREWHEELSSGS